MILLNHALVSSHPCPLLHACPQVLVLCYNELTRLEGLEGLVHLHTLDLGHNSIRKVGRPGGDRVAGLEERQGIRGCA